MHAIFAVIVIIPEGPRTCYEEAIKSTLAITSLSQAFEVNVYSSPHCCVYYSPEIFNFRKT